MSQYYCSPIGDKATQYAPTTYSGHNVCAVDIPVPENTPVYAMSTGIVNNCGDGCEVGDTSANGGQGNFIQLQIPSQNWANGTMTNDLYIRYMHLIKGGVNVIVGQQVNKGDIIGYSGNTGDSTGPHLHIDLSTDPYYGRTKIEINENNSSKFNELSQLTTVKNLEKLQGTNNAFNNYTYYIFGQNIQKISINNNNDTKNKIILTQTGNVPKLYYTAIFSEDIITRNTNYNFTEMMDYAGGLCFREVGASLDGEDATISGIGIYAKLIRSRMMFGNSLEWVFRNSGFEGFNWQKLSQLDVNESLRGKIKETIELNLCYPEGYNLLQQHSSLAAAAPYYNFGYSGYGYPKNTKDIENELTHQILNNTIDSHIRRGNSRQLLQCVGNTAYFSLNEWI